MSEIKEVWDMLWDVYDKAKGTPWENVVPVVVIGAVFFLLFKLVVVPLAKGIFNLYNYISKKWFVKKNVYEKLSFMESSDLYYAIKNYIPTRYSRNIFLCDISSTIQKDRYEKVPDIFYEGCIRRRSCSLYCE